jgi:signal transduction histidine kinase
VGGNPPDQVRLRQLAEEQATLRRVATLVAQGTPPGQVFAAVAEEIGHLLSVDLVNMCRYDPDRTITFLASWGSPSQRFPVGSRLSLGGHNLGTLVYETGRPGRIESYANDSSIGAVTVEAGIRSAVGTPITVEGRLWGVISAGWGRVQPLPPDAEERLASFTELVATAIANADSRAELMASRARIVAAADETRRRIQRDLHDGTQQQLVTLIFDLQQMQEEAPPELQRDLSRIAGQVTGVLDQVREISRGIHPAILPRGA